MKIQLITICLMSTIACVAAQAQGLTQPWDEITPLTPQDRAIIRSTVQSQIHGKRPQTAAKWTNPASGHSGTITLLSKSARQDMPCERIEYRIIEPGGRQQHGRYVFTSCQLPDGNWKLAE
jgi:exopolyphosphatase/pppGpp-phosphohydrolase